MSANTLGTLVSGLAALLFIVLTLATFRARRADRRAQNLVAIRETNVAAIAWAYQVRTLAAAHGWTLPPLPREMTPEYLAGKATDDANPELDVLAKLAEGMLPHLAESSPPSGGRQA